MKHYKEVQRTATVVDHETCDKCGKRVEDCGWHDANELNLEWKFGNQYPDCGDGVVWSVDLCFGCRADLFNLLKSNGYKINFNLLKSNGYKINVREYDY